MKTIILIPAYQPDEKLITLINELICHALHHIVVVNDGSSENHRPLFKTIEAISTSITVIHHTHNQGKGAALKTGFQYCQSQEKNAPYTIITADADGQHAVADIKKLAHLTHSSDKKKFILGIRDFCDVPLRSKFGNTLTRWIFKKLFGKTLTDTQTGLRAISSDLIAQFLTLNSGYYEFETDCLISAIKLNVEIQEIEIKTIYIDNNASSHFRPIRDSVRIYMLFFRLLFSR